MALSIIQREGTIKFGLTAGTVTVATDVHSAILKRTYDNIEIRGTFASSRNVTKPGNYQEEFTVKYDNDGTNSSTTLGGLISQAAWAATPSTILYFEFIQDVAAVGADNQRFTGTVSVLEALKGGVVGEVREHEITLPVLTITIANV